MGRFIIWTKGAFEKLDSLFGTYEESAKFKSGFIIFIIFNLFNFSFHVDYLNVKSVIIQFNNIVFYIFISITSY